jgi:hypothetical protein
VGQTKFKLLRIRKRPFRLFAGGLQWDGKYVVAGASSSTDPNVLDRFKIQNKAQHVGTATLHGGDEIAQFWIQRPNVIAANNGGTTAKVWKYPAGGKPIETIRGLSYPWGVTVSLAPR